MGADRTRVLGLALACVALTLVSALAMDWFTVDGATTGIRLAATGGMFGDTALYAALLFALVVVIEAIAFATGAELPLKRIRWGYGVGATALLSALAIAYLMPPEIKLAVLHRTWAPWLMVAGMSAGIAVGYYASGGGYDDFAGEYKRIVITPPPGAVPVAEPTGFERIDTSPGMKPLKHLRGKLAYGAMTAQLTKAGIEVRLEDGVEHLVMWRDVIGIVARRMPEAYAALPFVDVVSTAGATLRLLPWTRYTGEPIELEPRALARQLVAWCPRATLDPATQAFLDGSGEAAQLPDLATLAAHDEKLA